MAKTQPKKPFISVIIPCFNEEMRVAEVIRALLKCSSADEIIAVNDGSTDNTFKVLNRFRNKIKIVSYRKNQGKGFAMAAGIKKAQGEIVVFLDAHLLNLKNSHIKRLTLPLIKDQADAVLGKPPPVIIGPLWRFTGQRAYWKKSLLPHLAKIKKTRYGVETYLNEVFKEKRVLVVKLPGLVHLTKHQKMPPSQVLDSYLTEAIEIAQTLAKIKGVEPKRIKKIFDPKKIKSIKALRKAIEKIKDKKVLALLKKYILSYLSDATP